MVDVKKPDRRPLVALTIRLAVEFGLIIAVPLLLFASFGGWLDAKTGHQNVFVLVGILLALVCSVTVLSKRINRIRKELMRKE